MRPDEQPQSLDIGTRHIANYAVKTLLVRVMILGYEKPDQSDSLTGGPNQATPLIFANKTGEQLFVYTDRVSILDIALTTAGIRSAAVEMEGNTNAYISTHATGMRCITRQSVTV